MTVESNYAIAIAKLTDWLKNIAPLFHPMRSKNRTNHTFARDLSKLRAIARNSDCLFALFAAVIIGRSIYSGIHFSTVI